MQRMFLVNNVRFPPMLKQVIQRSEHVRWAVHEHTQFFRRRADFGELLAHNFRDGANQEL
jgi:hypothetical protein